MKNMKERMSIWINSRITGLSRFKGVGFASSAFSNPYFYIYDLVARKVFGKFAYLNFSQPQLLRTLCEYS